MANRALGIGEGLFPPARFATEHGAEHCLKQVKMLIGSITKDVEKCKHWLQSARVQCSHGEWGALLKKYGISRTTAWRIITSEDEPEATSECSTETNDDVNVEPDKDLQRLPDGRFAPPTPIKKSDVGSPVSVAWRAAQKKEKEEPLDRAKRVISEQIDQAETFHLVDEKETARLKNELHSIVSRAWKLFNAPKRAAMKPVHKKCWRCAAEIVIAQSAKSGKPVAYEKGKGRYIYDPDGRMEHTKFGGEYFPHHVRCPGVKK